ncbi:potassium channel protein [Marinomonas agarivorans]|nr:potassium channel protein [Marinomonas agarivorans]
MSSLWLAFKKSKNRTHFRKQVMVHSAQDMKARFLLFAFVILVHSAAMVLFEDLGWWQAFWLTMTSASTTGYGDISAATVWGQTATIVLIYGIGIALLAQIASDYIETRIQKKEMGIKGQLEWEHMKDHLLIINTPKYYTESYLNRLVQQISLTPDLEQTPIQFLTPHFPDGLPTDLRRSGVVHHTAEPTQAGALERSGADKAKYIVILSPDSQDPMSDSLVFDSLYRLKEMAVDAYIVAEAVNDDNRLRFRNVGANAVIRPVRAYPEILVRALIAPGTEQVLENLFHHQGGHITRFVVSLQEIRWSEVVVALIEAGVGTALGYEDDAGNIVTHPMPQQSINAISLIVLVGEEQDKAQEKDIQALFK